jgi:hypothetical protein
VKSPLQYWCNDHENQFPNVAFLAQQFLNIPRSEIETKRIFDVDVILTSLRLNEALSNEVYTMGFFFN